MAKMIKPHENLPNKWQCLVCNEMFSRRESAKDHLEGRHLRMYSYECQFCSKMFTCGSQRRAHIHLKHREENRLNKLMTDWNELYIYLLLHSVTLSLLSFIHDQLNTVNGIETGMCVSIMFSTKDYRISYELAKLSVMIILGQLGSSAMECRCWGDFSKVSKDMS